MTHNYDKDQVKDALRALIVAPDAPWLYECLCSAVDTARKLPIKLVGPAAAMNPLLKLAQDDPAEYESCRLFVFGKREERGLPPLIENPVSDGKFEKNTYQAQFMADGRRRRSRASTIENLLRPKRDKLMGAARMEFERVTQATWKKQRDAMLEKTKAAACKSLSKEDMQSVLARFWAAVDTSLDEKELEAKRKQIGD
jgi:hypothetical protein